MGTKKDYWNFINDSLPKDEIVKFVQTIQEVFQHEFMNIDLALLRNDEITVFLEIYFFAFTEFSI